MAPSRQSPPPLNVSRRGFLTGLGALVLGLSIPASASALAKEPKGKKDAPASGKLDLNAFVGIATTGVVTVLIPSSEMGQGISTGLAQVLAEELDVSWSQVVVKHAEEGKDYRFSMIPGDSRQMTGGSFSIRTWRDPMRQAGATARAMLVQAAANRWNVSAKECSTQGGVVSHSSGKSAAYGELVADASQIKAPRKVPLKDPADFKLAGTSVPREDLKGKVTGTTQYGVDVRLPGMLRVYTVSAPVFGGTVESVDDTAARAVKGVIDVIAFDDFVAVIAKTWWPARKAADLLSIRWNEGANGQLSSQSIAKTIEEALNSDKADTGRKEGKALKLLEQASEVLEATYEVPYVDHAPMEPLNCTVHLQADRCDVWVGTQGQTLVKRAAIEITGLDESQVHVHTVYLGGGFGRRGSVDYCEQALKVATKVDAPVQLLWSREENIQHGFYRPAQAAKFKASTADGQLQAIHMRVAGDNSSRIFMPPWMMKLKVLRTYVAEGLLFESPYDYPNVLVDVVNTEFGIPVGYWRSVGHSYTSFFRESFLDEVAHSLKQDPVEFRRILLKKEHPRLRAVLDKVVEESGWGRAPDGHFQGVAIQESFGSICAQVVEISMDGDMPRIEKITAAVDCGVVVNPDQVKAQIMGGAIFGISSAMGEEITFEGGRVQQSNFHDYPLLRMNQSPLEFDVHIMDQPDEDPGGVGEPGTPPAIPAFTNAIFAATGKRIRRLPILSALKEEL